MTTKTKKKPGPKTAKRWIRSSADERAVRDGHYFDERAAEHVVDFHRHYIRHSVGEFAGDPFEPMDWQRDQLLYPLYGWMRANGTRRYRLAYVEIPKKNGKSTMCAALALYHLVVDNEPGAEVYGAASDRSQASIVFREACAMVRASPAIAATLQINRTEKRLTWIENRAWYQVLSGDSFRAEGINASLVIFDELHAQKTRALWDALRYAGAARRQPLTIAITTAGHDRQSICWEQHQYASRVLAGADGFYDPAFFALIHGAEENDDWKDPAIIEGANPSCGITVQLEDLLSARDEAIRDPAKENSFRRYRLNQWTKQDVRYLSMDEWKKCALPFTPDQLEGRPCYVGLDLATTRDLTALTAWWPPLVHPGAEPTTDDSTPVASLPASTLPFSRGYLYTWGWLPEESLAERQRQDAAPYLDWVRRGELVATPGNATDFAFVRAEILSLARQHDIRAVAYDPWNAQQMASELANAEGLPMVQFRQGYRSFTGPCHRLNELIGARTLAHAGQPLLNMAAENVAVTTDPAGNQKPDKAKSTQRIDPIVAGLMALGAWIEDPLAPTLAPPEADEGTGAPGKTRSALL